MKKFGKLIANDILKFVFCLFESNDTDSLQAKMTNLSGTSRKTSKIYDIFSKNYDD